jgi:L-rhamnose isomerase
MPNSFKPSSGDAVAGRFQCARDHYAAFEVDVDRALEILSAVSLSLHCWQGDDVTGFENGSNAPGGGLAVTGNHPGKARNAEELRADLDLALSLIPGKHRVNLHACYGEFGGKKIDRDAIEPRHFENWISWARSRGLGLDFNPTCFNHPWAASGFTLSHPDKKMRAFWIEHCRRGREIGAAMGRALGKPCVTNLWIPDGFKDTPADRNDPRERLLESLDAVFQTALPAEHVVDSLESKLFGLGLESCTVGSHEFYLGYAITRKKLLCLDTGHFHPTESVADKISSVLLYLPEILLHLSRGVRWDSDHVVTLTDDLQSITREIVSGGFLNRVHLGLDYFDASINRIAAWVIGSRAVGRALLTALLEPPAIRRAEMEGDLTARLALQEEAKMLPLGPVWDRFCEKHSTPPGAEWLASVKQYEHDVLAKRG